MIHHRNHLATFLILALAAITTPVTPAEEKKLVERDFYGCFLYRSADGKVWIAEPLVSLGMIGVMAGPPRYYLSPELAERMAPLVNDLAEPPENPFYWSWDLPPTAEPEAPVTLVRMETGSVVVEEEADEDGAGEISSFGRSKIHEVRSAKLICSESISAKWRKDWKSLNTTLGEIVTISLGAPGKEKSQNLTAAIERAIQLFNSMQAETVRGSDRETARKVQPGADCVRLFQNRVEGSEPGNWGGTLREMIDTLQLETSSELPGPAKPCPKIELLAASEDRDAFLAKVGQSCSADSRYEGLIYSKSLGKTVFMWQVTNLTAEQFDALRLEAQAELDRRAEVAAKRDAEQPPAGDRSFELPEWGVVLREAGTERLAAIGALRGTEVKKLTGGGKETGLRAGDVILDYERVYDLVMRRFGNIERHWKKRVKWGGKLRVVRGDQIVELEVEGQKQ